MRIIKTFDSNWSESINGIEDNVRKNISNDMKILFGNTEGYIKHHKYKIYRDQQVLDGLKVTFVFTISTNKSYSQTYMYFLYTDVESDFYTLEYNLNKDKKKFKINDYENVKKFIINDLIIKDKNIDNNFLKNDVESIDMII